MANVTLLHYNNYFNRIVKKESSYSDYRSADISSQVLANINFVPGDGINTSLIIGTSTIPDMVYDYLIVSHTSGSNEVIDSRWFIIDEKRTRSGQYEIGLRRDVIVDNYNVVMNAPIFLEKGYVNDTTNPLLYNSESMTYNQKKISETLLKDKTTCGWVVGYIPRDAFQSPTTITAGIAGTIAGATDIPGGIENWAYWAVADINANGKLWTSSSSNVNKIITLKTKWQGQSDAHYYMKMNSVVSSSDVTSNESSTGSYDSWSSVLLHTDPRVPGWNMNWFDTNVYNNLPSNSTMWGYFNSIASELHLDLNRQVQVVSPANITALQNVNGEIIHDPITDAYYRVTVVNRSASSDDNNIAQSSYASQFLSSINNSINRGAWDVGGWSVTGNHTAETVGIGLSQDGWQAVLTQVIATAAVEIDSARNHVLDAPYDMFCIPYSDTKKVKIGSTTVTCSKELAAGIAQEIAADSGSQSVYDVQLLPYCPSSELIAKNPSATADNATFNLSGLSIDIIKDIADQYAPITNISIVDQTSLQSAIQAYGTVYDNDHNPIYYYSGDTGYYHKVINPSARTLGAIIWCTSCNRSFDISQTITVSSNPLGRKAENECDMYRLVSGNYQGAFEFSAAKSFGVSGFHVDCTFKPFNPYIHVMPKLNGLYGDFSQFGDARGLICGGDFSLAQLSNAWANYELQNKNYQAIFDRQIQNMDVNNSIAMQEAAWQMAAGVIGGGVSGAISGATVGGGVGAAVGGVLGTGANVLGGILDMQNLQKRQEEARSYATDMYGYQLGNVKAIPTSISKTSAITANTKIFPFVEKYTCTPVERQALIDKIVYDGMTIMVVTTLNSNVVSGTLHFYKGKIIRLDSYSLASDSHMANVIYEELNKGVYM